MIQSFDPEKAARYVFEAHASRAAYCNLPPELARLLEPTEGKIAGLKIATTTKVMQQLMGIDHPCGGLIFARRIFQSPAEIRIANHMHLVLECELAVRIGRSLPRPPEPYT